MATIGAGVLNIVDVVKSLNPDGTVAKVAELLNRVDEIMYDIPWVEGNTTTGEQLTIRTGIPVPVFRRMNQGITPTKSTKGQIIESCAQLADISTVDVDVANLGGNPGAVRLSESYAHIEGMNQVFMNTLWYGTYVTPESFIGLAPRYGSLSAGNSQNVIDGGGTSSNCTSVWLIGWGPETVYGIYPKGSKGGLEHIDEGRQIISITAGLTGTLMPAYVDTYKWNCGIAVKDWRYVIRIANIDVNNLVGQTTATDLANKMIRAMARIPYGDRGNFSFVMNRTAYEMLAIQRREDVRAGGQLTFQEVDGKFIPMFQGIPIRKSDSILLTESQVS